MISHKWFSKMFDPMSKKVARNKLNFKIPKSWATYTEYIGRYILCLCIKIILNLGEYTGCAKAHPNIKIKKMN